MAGHDHDHSNSLHSTGFWLNYTKISEHLEAVSGLVHTQYQNILSCFAFHRAV